MAQAKKKAPSKIPVMLHPLALAELQGLDAGARADVAWVFQQLDGKDVIFIRSFLDKRSESKIAHFEGSHAAGTLRVVFAWGKGCLWFIGAFVKANNAEGERIMKRIKPRANEVKTWGSTK